MIIPVLSGWTPGEKVTSTKLTNHTKNAIEAAVYYKPFCHITNAASQPLGNGNVAVQLPTIVEDTDGMAGVAASRIDIKTAGVYRLTAQICWLGTNTTGPRGINIYRNGTNVWVAAQQAASSGTSRLQWTHTVRLAVGENIAINSQNGSGVSLNSDPGLGGCYLTAEWVSL
jgi:hypothetical protein